MTTQYFEQMISPAAGGFGEWQADPINGDAWVDESDLAAEMAQGAADMGAELIELGVDDLPEGVEDIRGRIHNEPARVFAILADDGNVAYTGIAAC